jgi:hypothetical protein
MRYSSYICHRMGRKYREGKHTIRQPTPSKHYRAVNNNCSNQMGSMIGAVDVVQKSCQSQTLILDL